MAATINALGPAAFAWLGFFIVRTILRMWFGWHVAYHYVTKREEIIYAKIEEESKGGPALDKSIASPVPGESQLVGVDSP